MQSEEPGNFLCKDSPCGKGHAFSEAEELQGKWQQDPGLQSLSEHTPGQYQRDSALPTTGNTSAKAFAAPYCVWHISSSPEDHPAAESRQCYQSLWSEYLQGSGKNSLGRLKEVWPSKRQGSTLRFSTFSTAR